MRRSIGKGGLQWDAASSALWRRGVGLAAAGLVASACVGRPAPPTSTILFASGADLQSINPLVTVHPLAKQVQKHVLFMTLAAYDTAFVPEPRLAEWEWNSDRSELTFGLRDVRWHDGVPTTADDVVWTLTAARDPRTAYPRARDLDAISAVDAIDPGTVRVRFARPQPRFPDVLTDLAILPAHLLRDVAPDSIRRAVFNRRPIGNGPFAFVEYRPNQRWVFQRVDAFPPALGVPDVERFVVVVVDEPTTKLAALTSGELDFAGINPAHASFVRDDPRLRVIDYPVHFAYAMIWNHRRDWLRDVRVRMALTQALDRQLLIDAYLYGFGALADGPVSPGHPWFEPPEEVRFDPDRARSALDDLGWTIGEDGIRVRDGRPFAFDLLTVGSGDNALEQMIQAQLREVGVAVRIRQLELATFLSVAQGPDRDYDALVTGIPGDLSLGHVAALYESDPAGPLAYAGYANDAFDAAIRRARTAVTDAEQESAWRDAQRILSRDFPTTWLYHARGVQGVSRRVEGVRLDLRGELAGVSRWRLPPKE